MSRAVFRRDWKARRPVKVDWLGRALELLAIFLLTFLICLRW